MLRGMKRAEFEQQRRDWWRALYEIARIHKGKPVETLLGSLAWGRSQADASPDERVTDVAYGVGYLHGYRDAALKAAGMMKLDGEDDLRRIHARIQGFRVEGR